MKSWLNGLLLLGLSVSATSAVETRYSAMKAKRVEIVKRMEMKMVCHSATKQKHASDGFLGSIW